jgi:rhamnosyl/mannosyltransferase
MRSKIRVLHLAKYYPPARGGMERMLQLLCESTQDDVDNHVLAANTSARTVDEYVGRVRVTRAACIALVGSVPVCPSFPIWMRRSHADLTVLHEPNAPALVAECVAPVPGPLVIWYHADLVRPGWIYRPVYRPLLQRVLRKAASVIVSSPRLAASAEALRDVRHKCAVVPFGIDAASRDRPAPMPDWLREFKASRRAPMALTVGRMVPYKGIDVLLRALVGTDVSAVIVGSGPQLDGYRRLSSALGIADRVLFAGNVSDEELTAAYQGCDMFVLPSVTRQEAFGVVQLEAMACAKPVISTDLPTGVPWVNQHRRTGVIVPPRDVFALRHALVELGHNHDLRERLGREARRRAVNEFRLDVMKERIVSIYRRVIESKYASANVAFEGSPAASRTSASSWPV